MSKYTAEQIKNWDSSIETTHHEWIPDRPENYKFVSLKIRIKHAWGVITRKYDVLDWEEHRTIKK